MKSRLPQQFQIYASRFSIKSMLESIAKCAFDVYNQQCKVANYFADYVNYEAVVDGSTIRGRVLLAQTWLIDLMYDISCLEKSSTKDIAPDQTLHLINMYNEFCNTRDTTRLKNRRDALINAFGFFGEQKRFQNPHEFFDIFSREKYILEKVSYECYLGKRTEIDTKKVFSSLTGYTFDEYSALILALLGFFIGVTPYQQEESISIEFKEPVFSKESIMNVANKYSISLDEIKKHPLKRQVFYLKPLIKIDNELISVNPMLLYCLFANSNYWILRDYYFSINSQLFTSEFGKYYEQYVGEVLSYCLSEDEYHRIDEDNREKRADWIINIDNQAFLVEQKSCLSKIEIKQNQTDINKMKEYMVNCWGEACAQLKATEDALNLNRPVKIILLYEDYYKCECLDELFALPNNSIYNDGFYWLLSICELESLLLLYKDNPKLFKQIINEKMNDEIKHSIDGREILKYFEKYDIKYENYIKRNRINTIDEITSLYEYE